jgi:hypothetical protein
LYTLRASGDFPLHIARKITPRYVREVYALKLFTGTLNFFKLCGILNNIILEKSSRKAFKKIIGLSFQEVHNSVQWMKKNYERYYERKY